MWNGYYLSLMKGEGQAGCAGLQAAEVFERTNLNKDFMKDFWEE